MMRTDRVLGGVVASGGVFLLVYLIPHQVTSMPDELRDPALFPKAAGWLLLGLGVLQMLFAGPSAELPSLRDLVRLGLFLALLTLAAVLLPVLGFVPTAIGLMAGVMLVLYERRPHWLLVSVLGVPVGVWTLFEAVVERPLP